MSPMKLRLIEAIYLYFSESINLPQKEKILRIEMLADELYILLYGGSAMESLN